MIYTLLFLLPTLLLGFESPIQQIDLKFPSPHSLNPIHKSNHLDSSSFQSKRMIKRYNFGPVIQDGDSTTKLPGDNNNKFDPTPTTKPAIPTFPPHSRFIPTKDTAATGAGGIPVVLPQIVSTNFIIPIDSSTPLPSIISSILAPLVTPIIPALSPVPSPASLPANIPIIPAVVAPITSVVTPILPEVILSPVVPTPLTSAAVSTLEKMGAFLPTLPGFNRIVGKGRIGRAGETYGSASE